MIYLKEIKIWHLMTWRARFVGCKAEIKLLKCTWNFLTSISTLWSGHKTVSRFRFLWCGIILAISIALDPQEMLDLKGEEEISQWSAAGHKGGHQTSRFIGISKSHQAIKTGETKERKERQIYFILTLSMRHQATR